ncbi:MAG: DUF4149 domain-containing protein [Proteobacteria bacterium]|nr:DUF4149 domain-containing protein [Pseudomonadota bacterium]
MARIAVAERIRRLLPALWLGLLAAVALIGTPAPFAELARDVAGRVAGRMLLREAWFSIVVALLLWMLERGRALRAAAAGRGSVLSTEMVLLLATLLCTLLGYFIVQALLPAARLGQGALGFAQLHAVSVGFYAVKLLLVATLAWRAAAPPTAVPAGPPG